MEKQAEGWTSSRSYQRRQNWNMESNRFENDHKHQGSAHIIVNIRSKYFDLSISFGIFRKHYNFCVRKVVLCKKLPITFKDSLKYMELLSRNK
ncbi:hypothetical protein AYI70_g906 [Smittium culicis]|uniref:Uncharacterized protein n=1 Tax=Smittium culicis TaxID=133412 RepID=A0A1R1YEQ2_9FUNG|nr:hypothetical protein AYI70_g906 [Smittium culicis]